MDRTIRTLTFASVLAAVALPACAQAQSLPYGPSSAAGDDSAGSGAEDGDGILSGGAARGPGRNGASPGRVRFTPYIEADQVVSASLSPQHEVLSWSTLAAGVDGGVAGRNTQASFSIRYEHRFGWGKTTGGDTVSGVARGAIALVPQTLSLEAGGLATRTTVDGNSSAVPSGFASQSAAQLYSLYVGPSLKTHAGVVAVDGHYRLGYSRVGTSDALRTSAAPVAADTFDHSTNHNAELHAGVRPGDVLPVGLGVGAGYMREDVSNLGQRVKDAHVRADVVVPVSSSVALVGGVGYEDVKVSSRDVLRDAAGAPVRGSDGRWVTDNAAPRKIAYQSNGFVWDAGVTWRPSVRTALEAHVGRRYGSTTYYGSFGWRPSSRSTLSVSVYDSISGFGGQLNRALVALPTDFQALRNPITGDINGCVNGTSDPGQAPTGSGCLTSTLGSLRSAVFRERGGQASYATQVGRLGVGIAGGYDRRKYIAAPGTILAAANGVVDEDTWLSAWLTGRLDERSSFSTYVYGNWFHNGQLAGGEGTAVGANALFSRDFGNRISGTAAVGVQGTQRQTVEDEWQASALLGLRYSFF